jgi:hypothetical protein
MKHLKETSFAVGTIVATTGAIAALQEGPESFTVFLLKHAARGNGRIAAPTDESAIERAHAVVSKFTLMNGIELFVMTEAERDFTTVLLADEY